MANPSPDWQGSSAKHKAGAWKVAYADFVTALMALFIVLWMLNSGKAVRESVSRYFRDPKATATKANSATNPSSPGGGGSGSAIVLEKKDIHELEHRLQEVFKRLPEYEFIKKHIRVTVTGEGLRIELLDTDSGMFFELGSQAPTPTGLHLMELLARELSHLSNTIIVEGHTDARPFRNESLTGYSNWDLSLDRANSARKTMEGFGLRPDQVIQIRGFSDKKPLAVGDPENSRNRRVSVTVVYWSDELSVNSPAARP